MHHEPTTSVRCEGDLAPPYAPPEVAQEAPRSISEPEGGLRQLQNSILRLSRLAWQVAAILKEDRVVILARMRHL